MQNIFLSEKNQQWDFQMNYDWCPQQPHDPYGY